jgi:hypothetical protein
MRQGPFRNVPEARESIVEAGGFILVLLRTFVAEPGGPMHRHAFLVRRRAISVAAALVSVITIPILGALPGAGANSGEPRCSTATLVGAYGMTAQGAFAGAGFTTVARLVFDGVGKMSGQGTAVVDSPSAVETFKFTQGTYTMREDCTGTMRFFSTEHKNLKMPDHWHATDFVVADGGKQLSMIFVTMEMHEGTQSLPVEALIWSGHRQ